jgi:hypothetical protein
MIGRFVTAALVLILAFRTAEAGDVCRFQEGGAHYIEWVEQGQPHGARILSRDPRWVLGELGWHATSGARCQSCANKAVAGAVLWLGLDASPRDLGEAVTPETAARWMRPFPFQVWDADFQAKSDVVPASVGTLVGWARAIGYRHPDGRAHQVISLAVADGCLALFGILSARNAGEISLDRLELFASAIAVERYQPMPTPRNLAPPPAAFSLEDFRKGLQQQQR